MYFYESTPTFLDGEILDRSIFGAADHSSSGAVCHSGARVY